MQNYLYPTIHESWFDLYFSHQFCNILQFHNDALLCKHNVITSRQCMRTAIKTRIVRIGNSQGIRIPKTLLEQSGISTDVEIELQDGYLVIRAVSRRKSWDEAFAAMAEQKDDTLLDDVSTTEWDQAEWEW